MKASWKLLLLLAIVLIFLFLGILIYFSEAPLPFIGEHVVIREGNYAQNNIAIKENGKAIQSFSAQVSDADIVPDGALLAFQYRGINLTSLEPYIVYKGIRYDWTSMPNSIKSKTSLSYYVKKSSHIKFAHNIKIPQLVLNDVSEIGFKFTNSTLFDSATIFNMQENVGTDEIDNDNNTVYQQKTFMSQMVFPSPNGLILDFMDLVDDNFTVNYNKNTREVAIGNLKNGNYRNGILFLDPTLVSSCGTLDQDNTEYILQQSVNSTNGCFYITGNGITLDGNGTEINYSSGGKASGFGIIVNNGSTQTGKAIENITIKNFTLIRNDNGSIPLVAGIYINTTNNVTIQDIFNIYTNATTRPRMVWVTLSNNTMINNVNGTSIGRSADPIQGIEIARSNYTILNNSNISRVYNRNSGSSTGADTYGLFLNASNFTIIDNTVINGTDGIGTAGGAPNHFGIYFLSSRNATIKNTNVTHTLDGSVSESGPPAGIFISSTPNVDMNNVNVLYSKQSQSKTMAGIRVSASNNVSIAWSTIGNTQSSTANAYGIYLVSSDFAVIENSNITGSTAGSANAINIFLSDSNNATIRNNTINSANGDGAGTEGGIYLTASQNATITNNTILSNERMGIYFSATALYNTVTNSTITGSTENDVYFDSPNAFNNTINLTVGDVTSVLWFPDWVRGGLSNSVLENISITGNGNTNYGKLTIGNADNATLRNINITGINSAGGNTTGIYLYKTNGTTLINVNASQIRGTSTASPVVYGIIVNASNYTNISASNFNNNSVISGSVPNAYGMYIFNSNFTNMENTNASGTTNLDACGGITYAINIYISASVNATMKNVRANSLYHACSSSPATSRGMYIYRSNNATIADSEIRDNVNYEANTAAFIIGLYIESTNNAVISSSRITDNRLTSTSISAADAFGVYLLRSNFTTIRDSNVSGTLTPGGLFTTEMFGIGLENSHNATIRSVELARNSMAGLQTSSSGIYLTNSNNNTIVNATLTNNTFYGILINGSSNFNTISDSVITSTRNNEIGIRLFNAHNNTIENVNISTVGTTAYGIYLVFNASNNTIRYTNITTTSATTSHAFYITGGNNNTISDSFISTAATNASRDIQIDSATGGNFIINTSFNKSDIGFLATSNAPIFVQWYLDVLVQDNSNNPQSDITVWGNDTDSTSNFEDPYANNFTATTNSSGYIPRQTLTEFLANRTLNFSSSAGNNYLYFTNHTINTSATLPDHNINPATINLTSSMTVILTFTPNFVRITSCGTLAANNSRYIAQSNASSDGTCYFITGNNIVLDGNGTSINYSSGGKASGFGILVNNGSTGGGIIENITIKNFTLIRNDNTSIPLTAGIYLNTTNNVTIQDVFNIYVNATVRLRMVWVTLSNATTINNVNGSSTGNRASLIAGIEIAHSNYTTINSTNITNVKNDATGTSSDAFGLFLNASNFTTIERVYIDKITSSSGVIGSDTVGIYISSSNNATIRNSTITVDGSGLYIDAGIYLTNSQNATITNSTILKNDQMGIWFSATALFNTVTNSSINGSTNYDVYFDSVGAFNNTVNTTDSIGRPNILWFPDWVRGGLSNSVLENISLTGDGTTNYGKLTIGNSNNATLKNISVTGISSGGANTVGIYLYKTNATTLVDVNVSAITVSASSPTGYSLYVNASNYTNISNSNFNNNTAISDGSSGSTPDVYGIYLTASNFTTIENTNASGTRNLDTSNGADAYNIYLDTGRNTTITNVIASYGQTSGTISGFGVGIYITSSPNTTIISSEATDALASRGDGAGISITSSNYASIRDVQVNGTRGTGIDPDVYGIYVINSNFTSIRDSKFNNITGGVSASTADNSQAVNVFLSNSHNATIRNVTAEFSGATDSSGTQFNRAGIYLTNSQNATITNVTVRNNNWYGIFLNGSSRFNTITDATIITTLASTSGIRLFNAHNNTIENVNISTSGSTANGVMFIWNASNNTIRYTNITTTSATTSHAFYITGGNNNTIADSFLQTHISNASRDIQVDSRTGGNFIVNSSFNKSDIGFLATSNAPIYVQWYLDVLTQDNSNIPLSGITVWGNDTDSVSNVENPQNNFTDTTNSSGYIPQQILTEFLANRTLNFSSSAGDNYLYFNNHIITATLADHNINPATINLTSSMTVILTFTPNFVRVTSCGTLAANNSRYIAQSNASSNGTCYFIVGNNLVLDGNGTSINYSSGPRGFGIIVNNGSTGGGIIENITIKNFTLIFNENKSLPVAATAGIYLNTTNNVTIQDMFRILTNTSASSTINRAIYITLSNATTINNVNASSDATTTGFVVSQATGIEIAKSNYTTINNSNINRVINRDTVYSGATTYGLFVNASNFTIIENTVLNGTQGGSSGGGDAYAIYLLNSRNITIKNTNVSQSQGTGTGSSDIIGIVISTTPNVDMNNVSVQGTNAISTAAATGISVTSSNNISIAWSTVGSTASTTGTGRSAGISLSSSDFDVIEHTSITGTTATSGDAVNIYLTASDNATIRNSTINSADGSGAGIEAGIYLLNSQNATMTNNTIRSNERMGIYFSATALFNTVTNSSVYGSTNYDVYFDSPNAFNNTVNTTDSTGATNILWFPTWVLGQLTNSTLENISITGDGSTNYGKLTIGNANNVTLNNISVTGNSAVNGAAGIYLYKTNATTLTNINSSLSSTAGYSLSFAPKIYGIYVNASNYTNISTSNFNNNTASEDANSPEAYGMYIFNSNFTTIENMNASRTTGLGTETGTVGNIVIDTSKNTTIRNAIINSLYTKFTSFSTVGDIALKISSSPNTTVDNVNASNNANVGSVVSSKYQIRGIYVASSNYAVIKNSEANDNSVKGDGLSSGSPNTYGIYITNSNFTTIEYSNASRTTSTDATVGAEVANIFLTNSHNATIRNVTANSVDGSTTISNINGGIYLTDTQNATITNVTLTNNEYYGILINGSSRFNTIQDSVITSTSNSVSGIRLFNSHNNTIINSNISTAGTSSYGILFVLNSSNNTIRYTNITTTSITTSHAFYIQGGNNNTISDSFLQTHVSNASRDIQVDSRTGGNFIINTSFNKSDIGFLATSNAPIFVQWYLDVLTQDNSNNPLASATVWGNDTDSTSNFEDPYANNFTSTTNSSGYIPQQILTEFLANRTLNFSSSAGNNYLYFTNHTINATKDGYKGASATINLTRSMVVILTLQSLDEGGFLNASVTYYIFPTTVWWNDSVTVNGSARYANQTGVYDAILDIIVGNARCSNTTDSAGNYTCTFAAPSELGNYLVIINVTNSTGHNITNTTKLNVELNYGDKPIGTIDRVVSEIPVFIQEMSGRIRAVIARITTWRS